MRFEEGRRDLLSLVRQKGSDRAAILQEPREKLPCCEAPSTSSPSLYKHMVQAFTEGSCWLTDWLTLYLCIRMCVCVCVLCRMHALNESQWATWHEWRTGIRTKPAEPIIVLKPKNLLNIHTGSLMETLSMSSWANVAILTPKTTNDHMSRHSREYER